MPYQRHFIGLRPDAAALASLGALRLPEDARAVPPGDLHVTLAFLGTLDEAGEERALAAAAAICRDARAEARFDAVELWARSSVVCAVAREPDPLALLAARLTEALRFQGFPPPDKSFRSHVTLARAVRQAEGLEGVLAAPIGWPVSELLLLASTPEGGVPRYAERGRVALQA